MKKEQKNKEPEYIEYEDGTRILLDEDDVPELTEDWFKNAKHGLDGLAELIGEEAVAPLRLRAKPAKKPIRINLDADIADKFRSMGRNWQVQLNGFLHKAIEQGMV